MATFSVTYVNGKDDTERKVRVEAADHNAAMKKAINMQGVCAIVKTERVA